MSLCMAACALFAATYSGTFHWAPIYRHGCGFACHYTGYCLGGGVAVFVVGLQLGMGSFVGVLTHAPHGFESCCRVCCAYQGLHARLPAHERGIKTACMWAICISELLHMRLACYSGLVHTRQRRLLSA